MAKCKQTQLYGLSRYGDGMGTGCPVPLARAIPSPPHLRHGALRRPTPHLPNPGPRGPVQA